MKIFSLALVALAIFGAKGSEAFTYNYPMVAVACHFHPYYGGPRANGYDCLAVNNVQKEVVVVDTAMSDLERMLTINRAFTRLGHRAAAACGASCRFFYGIQGYQCLAIAQSRYFTGLGSFLGKETSQKDSEATALRDCRDYVGQPGAECQIIVSECSPR